MLYIGDNDEAKEKANEDRSREEQRLYYVALTRAKARLYLPLVPDKLGGKKWEGGYWRLNERLACGGEQCRRVGASRSISDCHVPGSSASNRAQCIRTNRLTTWQRGGQRRLC